MPRRATLFLFLLDDWFPAPPTPPSAQVSEGFYRRRNPKYLIHRKKEKK